jgi:hypothetical protein
MPKTNGTGDMFVPSNKLEEVFEFWRQTFGRPNSRLDLKRAGAITQRLREGYSVEQLEMAILGCRESEWHNGQNDRRKRYISIELICRDADHVDEFIELAERAAGSELNRIASTAAARQPGVPPPPDVQAKIDALLGRHRRRSPLQ